MIGAAPHERTEARTAQRNGSRPRTLSTTAGDLELRISKLRAGSFFPSLLERRRRIDQALFALAAAAVCPNGATGPAVSAVAQSSAPGTAPRASAICLLAVGT